jgi:hypothetical protein
VFGMGTGVTLAVISPEIEPLSKREREARERAGETQRRFVPKGLSVGGIKERGRCLTTE